MSRDTTTRRQFLYATTASAGAVALAGCSGDGGGDDQAPPSIDDHLGDTTNEYDGTIEDATGQDEVTIDVGGGGGLAFVPPAVRIDAGTNVIWEWVGQGGPHNVSSVEGSDASFRSGERVDSSTETFEQTFDAAGVQLYVCEPHQSQGMRGGIEVVE